MNAVGAAPLSRLGEWRIGWPSVVGAMLATGAGLSMFVGVSGFFVKPLSAEFGWSRGQLSIASAAILTSSLLLPFIGALADRWTVRPLALLGAVTFALAYLCLSLMTGDYWQYLAVVSLICLLAGPTTAPFIFARPIVQAFDRSRGLALSVSMSGVPLLSFAIIPAIQHLIATMGWRYAFAAMAPLSLVLGLIAYWLFRKADRAIRATPSSEVNAKPARAATRVVLRGTVRDRRFWLLALSMLLANLAVGAVMFSLQPLLSDRGVSGSVAAWLGVWFACAVVIARLIFGNLLDRFSPPLVGALALGAPAIGLLLFLVPGAPLWAMIAGIALVSTAIGAEGELLAFFTSRFFGTENFGVIFGVLGMIYGVSVAIGAVMSGVLFDYFASYDVALLIDAAMAALAALAIYLTGHVGGLRKTAG